MSRERSRILPYYEQVANVLRAQITGADDSGPLALESERRLCDLHGVSRITIRKALDLLEAEGLIERAQGSRTRAVPQAVQRYKRLRQVRVIHIVTTWLPLARIPMSYYGQIYQGILSAVEQAGYVATATEWQGKRGSHHLSPSVRPPAADTTLGVILIGISDEPVIQMFAEAGYPVVCADYWPTNPKADAVVVDCFSEGQQAVEYLLRQGHKNLCFVGNIQSDGRREADAELFLAGVQRAMMQANLPPISPERVHFCQSVPEQIERYVNSFLSLQPRPTAGLIFQVSALEVLVAALKDKGIRCPDDLSLVSRSWPGYQTVATCLRSDALAIGELAVECILSRVNGRRSKPVRLSVPSHLERGRTVRYLDEVGNGQA